MVIPAAHAQHPSWQQISGGRPMAICQLSRDGRVVDVNQSALQLMGCPRPQVVGMRLADVIPELDLHWPAMLAAGKQGLPYRLDDVLLHTSAQHLPITLECMGMQREQLTLTLYCRSDWAGIDILQLIQQGVVVHASQGQLVYINRAAMRILNHSPQDAKWQEGLYIHSWDCVDEHGHHLPLEHTPAALALQTGQTQKKRIGIYQAQSKHFRWLNVTALPLGGQPPEQVLSLLEDVTEQQRNARTLERLQTLAVAGAWSCSHDSCTLTQGALRILGLTQQPRSLEAFLACFAPTDSQQLASAIEQARRGIPFLLEMRLAHPHAPEQWLRLRGELDRPDPFAAQVGGTIQDISREKRVQAHLHRKSSIDQLTGLLNREAILHKLRKRLSTHASALAVLYIDLDRFKTINDALGHYTGDLVLQEAARRLRAATPEGGRCARLGGDEFLILCPMRDRQTPAFVAESILGMLAQPFRIGHGSLHVSACIGVACAPQDGQDSSTLVQNADAAMSECKRRAGNTWQFYTQDMSHRQKEKLQLDMQLRHALDRQEIRLLYQPQVNLHTGRLVAAEALMRWHNPLLGEVAPDVFIRHAEASGEIIHLGTWALREACAQVRRWRDAGLPTVPVAVNVSYRQFLMEDLAHIVANTLRAANLSQADLELEFTERMLIEDEPVTTNTIARLREMGIALIIDDFGEGYSALSYLRRMPIQKLKLSRQFLQGLSHDSPDAAICHAIATMARSLGLDLIAEGVEDATQRQILRSLGVPKAQGYLFAPPLSAEDFARQWLAPPIPPNQNSNSN